MTGRMLAAEAVAKLDALTAAARADQDADPERLHDAADAVLLAAAPATVAAAYQRLVDAAAWWAAG